MLTFDNRLRHELPGDAGDAADAVRSRQVPAAIWSAAIARTVNAPKLLAASEDLAQRLGIDPTRLGTDPWLSALAGNDLLPGMQPWAHNYGGHQFGHWAGQLGDGRAMSLGEAVTASGERWELQLKGAGPTPYSRGSDGRAVLRSSLREFLCSEAMHHLGVPTTRALTLLTTGEAVVRDMFYSGQPKPEPGAIVCRVAPSFLRFGSFELPAARGEADLLTQLVDFCIDRDFPAQAKVIGSTEQRRAAWFAEVCRRSAVMVAHWMRVGFVHGVMNTDNMSILGLTLDYGPYGWIDDFDPDWTPNTTDREQRRYRFGQQPQVVYWNLARLAGALAGLFDDHAPLQAGLAEFVATFEAEDRHHTAAKLGLEAADDIALTLMTRLRELLQAGEVDMTLFFRQLADLDMDQPTLAPLEAAFYDPAKRTRVEEALTAWLTDYAACVRAESQAPALRRAQMNAVNPRFVLRNYLAQLAIDQAEAGDLSMLHRLQRVLQRPYDDQPVEAELAARRPEWARRRAGCSMLSCSS